jgi:hypothetical protein
VEAIGFAVTALPTANALDVQRGVTDEMARLSEAFPPGLRYQVAFDTTTVVRESIQEVVKTLAEALGLVVLVMFLFLQSWRATLIPALTMPVSLIGAFAFIKYLDFSINTLTLFAIVLATGIVVDRWRRRPAPRASGKKSTSLWSRPPGSRERPGRWRLFPTPNRAPCFSLGSGRRCHTCPCAAPPAMPCVS